MSNRKIGIGAFPLRPSKELREENGSVIIDPTSSEQALRKQIRKWLEAENGREQLLEQSIPQKGLHYTKKDLSNKLVYVGYVKAENPEIELFKRNAAKNYYTGNLDFAEVDLQQLKYLLPVVAGKVQGVYEIESIGFKKLSNIRPLRNGEVDNLRVVFTLGEFIPLLDSMISAHKKLHNHEVYSFAKAKEKLNELV